MTTAIFPGSFDPITPGHEAIARRAMRLFDSVVIAVGVNSDKHYMFSPEERVAKIKALFANEPSVEVIAYSGMTIDLCHQLGAQCIVRGIRNSADLDYEQTVAAVNQALDPNIETVLLLADEQHRDISSTLIREQLTHGARQ
ncbi:MAG: pantetheine-phosphate adenylyltransferase [Bacteroidales bacterium]|nr:pantetheine-phosphate adenylyltransferase [Bacteroidales bacterium]